MRIKQNPVILLPLILLLTAQLCFAAARTEPFPTLVTSIKPIHSITSHISDGVTQPKLLIHQFYSPHHYALRPSDLKLINKADLLIWVGPALESRLSKTLTAPDKRFKTITLLDVGELKLLHARNKRNHGSTQALEAKYNKIDPHIWLNPLNMLLIAKRIMHALIELDPIHSKIYQSNYQNLKIRLETLNEELSKTFSGFENRPYLVAHDAFQYLEQQYKLNSAGALSSDTDQPPSAKHRLRIHHLIQAESINCLLYEPLYPKKQIQQIAEENSLTSFELDYMGYTLSAGKELYFIMMKRLADTITQCLRGTSKN